MYETRIKYALIAVAASVIVARGVKDAINTHRVESAKRDLIRSEAGIEAAAIHRATEVVNDRISRGDIRNYDQLRKAVLEEVDFQKIVIHEEQS